MGNLETTDGASVVLLSGGLDSTTTLYLARQASPKLFAMSFDYGQRNRFELDAAREAAKRCGVIEHRVVTIDLRAFGGSSLTTSDPVEKDRGLEAIGLGIPSTYVPARNTLFLCYALAWSEVLGASQIFIGVNAVDSSGYPDCRPEFIEAFSKLANLATKLTTTGKSISIEAPLLHLRKDQIISRGLELGVDYSKTVSCYDPAPDGSPCGRCDSCTLRRHAFRKLNLVDPLPYPAD